MLNVVMLNVVAPLLMPPFLSLCISPKDVDVAIGGKRIIIKI